MGKAVKAKFRCDSIAQDTTGNKLTVFNAVQSGSEENKSFAKYTPSGSLTMSISPETEAYDAFEMNKEYYLTIEEATPAETPENEA